MTEAFLGTREEGEWTNKVVLTHFLGGLFGRRGFSKGWGLTKKCLTA